MVTTLRSHPTKTLASVLVGTVVTIGAACGGSSSDDVMTPAGSSGNASSSGSSGSTTGDASTTQEGGATTYTLDNVCEKTAPLVCEMRKTCCLAGAGYDEAGCLAHAKAECAKDVAEVNAGREAFHPEI